MLIAGKNHYAMLKEIRSNRIGGPKEYYIKSKELVESGCKTIGGERNRGLTIHSSCRKPSEERGGIKIKKEGLADVSGAPAKVEGCGRRKGE